MVRFEMFKTSVEEVAADVVGLARDLELEVDPEYMTELLQSHDRKLEQMRSYFLMDEQRKLFF